MLLHSTAQVGPPVAGGLTPAQVLARAHTAFWHAREHHYQVRREYWGEDRKQVKRQAKSRRVDAEAAFSAAAAEFRHSTEARKMAVFRALCVADGRLAA